MPHPHRIIGAILFAILFTIPSLFAQKTTTHFWTLFDETPTLSNATSLQKKDGEKRSRLVQITSKDAGGQIVLPTKVQLNLFEDVQFEVALQPKLEVTYKNLQVWKGRTADPRFDHLPQYRNVILVNNPNTQKMAGIVEVAEGTFSILPDVETGAYRITELEKQHFTCETIEENLAEMSGGYSSCNEMDGNGVTILDIFMGFSNSAAATAGDIDAYAMVMVEVVNTGLANSLVNEVRLRLVGTGTSPQNPGVVTSVLSDAWNWWAVEIEATGADFVAAFQTPTGASGEAGGWAGVGGYSSVNSINSSSGGVFRHEMGHNAGGGHCPGDYGVLPFAHGYDNGNWETHLCGNDVNFYSTPLVNDNLGNPIGTAATSDMARVFKERKTTMAGQRTHIFPFDENDDGCPPVASGGSGLSIGGSLQHVSCYNGSDGSATATPMGGTGSYTYNWSNGATAATISNRPAGTYSVTVNDGNNSATADFTIMHPFPLSLSFTINHAVGGNNGSATANPSGGRAPYTYSWSNGTMAATMSNVGMGMYSITVTDANGCTILGSVQIDDIAGTYNLAIPVMDGDDDAEEAVGTGVVSRSSSDLELIKDSSTDQLVGIRFQNVPIPANATVNAAYVQFTVDEADTEPTNLTIHGEASANASIYLGSNDNISNRTTTNANVAWSNVPAWNTAGESSVAQQTPDLTNLVTEIIGQSGWSAGNSMAFIISGTGQRTAESYNGDPNSAPVLHLTYSLGSGGGGYNPWVPSTVTRGPYLQSMTPNSIVIKWRTFNSTSSKIWFGTSVGNPTDSVEMSGNRVNHEMTLTGLTPNTTYFYTIGDLTGKMEGANTSFYFTTSPPVGTSQAIRAWVLGDCGTGNSDAMAVRDRFYNYVGSGHTDMILMLGDNAYSDGEDAEYQSAVFNIYDEKLKNTALWSCPGNHDYRDGNNTGTSYYNIFTFPTSGEAGGLASNTERYYSFDYGNIHIISLDSHDEDRSVGSPMLTWLENDLAVTSQEWIVVIFHHPPYSKGSHDSDSEGRLVEMRENVMPICEDYGVDLVLGGHSHAYERSKLIHGHYGHSSTYNPATHNIDGGDGRLDGDGAYMQTNSEEGTVYIVTGSAGKISGMSGTHPVMYYSVSRLGSTILEVDGAQMDVKFLNSSGQIEDYLTLTQGGAPSVNWTNPSNGAIFNNFNPISLEADASDNNGSVTQVEFFVNGVSVGVDMTAPYTTNWMPAAFANYDLKATATDNEGNMASKTITISVQDPSNVSLSIQINASDDDAEEVQGSGSMLTSSSDLEIVQDGTNLQKVGLRFNNITIPQGATIANAYIQFVADEVDSGTTNLQIQGQDEDNALTFSNSNSNISNRPTTSASIAWNPPAWNTVGVGGTAEQTPNIAAILQEIVNRGGWTSGNSMAFIFSGSGLREAFSYDGNAAFAATLHLTYSANGGCAGIGDQDSDGVCADIDCDDNDSNNTETDADGDGFCTPIDCNDSDAAVYPGAPCDDGDPNTNNDQFNSSCICEGSNSGGTSTLAIPVTANDDDAEEEMSTGSVDLSSTDLELADEGTTNQMVGMRFQNVLVPIGATITSAWVQFTVDETDSGTTNLTIQGEDVDHALTFSTTNQDISTRSTTTASVTWNPPAWDMIAEAGINQQTPDLSAILQEIIDRPNWLPGNAVVMLMSGTGERTAESYDGSPADAPILHINYTTSGGGCVPYGDADNDGICANIDCDDNDNTNIETDADMDGICTPTDCNDNNSNIYPGAPCNDGNPATNNDQYNASCICEGTTGGGGTVILEIAVSDGDDDVEETVSNGFMNFSSSDLEMTDDGSINQLVGIRFNNLNIPQGATIANAYLQFTVEDQSTNTTNLTIHGEAAGHSTLFTTTAFDLSNRSTTAASVNWIPATWPTAGVAGLDQRTPDLTNLVQEIINLGSWSPNNSMAFIISGSGERSAESYNGSPSGAAKLHVEFLGASTTTFETIVSASDDDAEETTSSGNMDITSSDLELVDEGSANQLVGMRFNNITVPANANITNAWIQFTVDEADAGTVNLTIQGEATANGGAFSTEDFDISNRSTTTASVAWSPPAWNIIGEAGPDQRTPDLSNIVQEVISFGGWTSGNSMVFILTGTGERTADSYDGSTPANAPKLFIEYTTGGGTTYCIPQHTNPENEWITNVSVNTINNASTNATSGMPGYSDFTSISSDLEIGTGYPLTVTSNYSWTDSKLGIWADWNQDGIFDVSEQITTQSGTGPWTATLTPPANAILGNTRLRIRLQYSPTYTPDPCAFSGYYAGETEDYTLNITPTTGNNCADNDLTLALQLDNYPEETSWEVVDNNNFVVASGGNYAGQVGAFLLLPLCLPDGCYTLKVYDSFGDGLCCGYGNGSYLLKDVNDNVLATGAAFGSEDITPFCLPTSNYCPSQGNDSSFEWLETVQIGNLQHTSGNNGGYADFTTQSITATWEEVLPVTLTPGFNGGPYAEHFRIWADLNQDGDFDDPEEELFAANDNEAVFGNIEIPATATLGATRLRVSMQYNAVPPTCGNFPEGEVEDYTLIINACSLQTYYPDTDNDSFGDPNKPVQACTLPADYVSNDLDCDDTNSNIYPNAPELCDGLDNDCDGNDETAPNIWTGNGDGVHWMDGENWSAGFVPLACQIVVIPAGGMVVILSGEIAAAQELEVALGGILLVELGGVLEVG